MTEKIKWVNHSNVNTKEMFQDDYEKMDEPHEYWHQSENSGLELIFQQ